MKREPKKTLSYGKVKSMSLFALQCKLIVDKGINEKQFGGKDDDATGMKV